jgi:hypothetical protein
LLIVLSIILRFCLYGVLTAKRAISRFAVLLFGMTLVMIAGVAYFNQSFD